MRLTELRNGFRKPLSPDETIGERMKLGHSKLSFLRITTRVKPRKESNEQEQSIEKKWVYKDGQKFESINGTIRDPKGRVLSSFDGKNLDPESVTRHRKLLKRAGFVNNQHAKGIF